jgi:hypothetical protein
MVRDPPVGTAQIMAAHLPRGTHPHPPAGGRGDGRRAAGGGTGGRQVGRGMRHGSGAALPRIARFSVNQLRDSPTSG